MINAVWPAALSFIASLCLTGLVRIYAIRTNLLDVPNRRSSHTNATARGGGLGIVVVFLGAVLIGLTIGEIELRTALVLVVGGLSIAAIGFADDHVDVDSKWRFLVQVSAASGAVILLGGLPPVQLGSMQLELGLVGDILLVIFAVWFTNVFNFMDGIDGIAASEAICIAVGVMVVGAGNNSTSPTILVLLIAATAGFLAWNWPPAKIFMGDVGSAFLGFVLIVIAIHYCNAGQTSIWVWLILTAVFVVDATVTIIVRILRRDAWLTAHRSHAYQKASRLYRSHSRVTIGVICINVAWLYPIACIAAKAPEYGLLSTLIAWTPLVGFSLWIGAGKTENNEAS